MDLFGLIYLFFRLSPFIIASFFSLISVFNSDLKGFIYLVGLIFTTAITMGSGTLVTFSFPAYDKKDTSSPGLSAATSSAAPAATSSAATAAAVSSPATTPSTSISSDGIPPVCNTLSLGGFSGFSKVPLSTAVLSYTFFYLVYTIGKNNMALYNIPTLILFPILILSDIGWNVQNGCYPLLACVVSLIVAGGLGVLWSYIISIYMPNMQYLIVGSNREMCMKPSDQTLICTDD